MIPSVKYRLESLISSRLSEQLSLWILSLHDWSKHTLHRRVLSVLWLMLSLSELCVYTWRERGIFNAPDLISDWWQIDGRDRLGLWYLFCSGSTVRSSFSAVIYSPQGHTRPLVGHAADTRARPRVEHCRFEWVFTLSLNLSAEIEQMCEQSYL